MCRLFLVSVWFTGRCVLQGGDSSGALHAASRSAGPGPARGGTSTVGSCPGVGSGGPGDRRRGDGRRGKRGGAGAGPAGGARIVGAGAVLLAVLVVAGLLGLGPVAVGGGRAEVGLLVADPGRAEDVGAVGGRLVGRGPEPAHCRGQPALRGGAGVGFPLRAAVAGLGGGGAAAGV